MKTFKTSLLTIATLLCSIAASAHDFEVDGIYYDITSSEDLTVEVTYKGNSSSSYFDEYEEEVIIPKSVMYEGQTYSVTSIKNSAFRDCSWLTSVIIPNSVTNIGHHAFENCSGLTNVTIPNSVTRIRNNMFQDCSSLTSITIPNSVTSISHDAFNCSGLTSITIPNSVTSIGPDAFRYCFGLTSVTIGNSVTSIGENAFYDCSGLIGVYITDLKAWCEIDFYFTELTCIPSNPLYYAKHLYLNGEEVKDLVIPDSVTSIENYAFYNYNNLTSITIPNSVTSIGDYAFNGCDSLTSITVSENNETYDSRDSCNAIIETSSNTLILGCQSTIIPDSVTSIGNYAFYNCNNLTSITIPDSVTSIGNYAFYNCNNLTSITIPNSVEEIEKETFRNCSNLTNVTIGNSVFNIKREAFRGCKSLKEVICLAEVPPTMGNDVFFNVDTENCVLKVPFGCKSAYQHAEQWNDFYTIEEISSGIEEVLVDENIKADIYTIDGRLYMKDADVKEVELPRGIYIVNGKKMVVR